MAVLCAEVSMAIWRLYPRAGTLRLEHVNLGTGIVHIAGDLRTDTPPTMVIDWVVKNGNPVAGDWLVMPDGTVLLFMKQVEEVAPSDVRPESPARTSRPC